MSKLNNIKLLNNLDDQEIDEFKKICKIHSSEKNKILFRQGDQSDSFFILISGKVELSLKLIADKRRSISQVPALQTFGEMALFDDLARSAQAETIESSKYIEVSKQDFLDFIAAHPKIGNKLLFNFNQHMAHSLRATNNRLAESVLWGFQMQA